VISGGKGTAADKFAALEAARVTTVRSPAELGSAIAARVARGGRGSAPRKPAKAAARPAAKTAARKPAKTAVRRRAAPRAKKASKKVARRGR